MNDFRESAGPKPRFFEEHIRFESQRQHGVPACGEHRGHARGDCRLRPNK